MIGDGGAWLRQQALLMSESSHTPLSFWLGIPLFHFPAWIRSSNEIIRQRIAKRKEMKK